MGLLMRTWLVFSLVFPSGCTLVLSSTPCDTADPSPAPDDTAPPEDTGDTAEPSPRTARTLAAGGHHTCAIDLDGTADCWGFDGALGTSTIPPELTEPSSLSAGYLFSCGLPATLPAAPVCWGDNGSGQLNTETRLVEPVAAGGAHACGVTEAGGVACWGRNTEGQATPPRSVSAASSVALLASGWLFSCAEVDEDRVPTCWGFDEEGQVSTVPERTFATLALGQGFGVGIDAASRQLACWGRGTICETVPVETDTVWADVVAGLDFACGLSDAGRAQCWGTNGNGILRDVPTGALSAISAGPGGRHACAIRDDGTDTVVCWGLDTSGQSTP